MKNKNPSRLIFTLLVGCLLLTGCARFRRVGTFGYNEPFDFTSKDVTKRNYENGSFRTNYDAAVASDSLQIAKRERNEILAELMFLIDARHGRLERNLRGYKTGFDLLTDFTQLGLTGAATVVGGESTKAVLAAIATGVKGAELSVNKRAFQEQAIEAILATMRAAQAERKAAIITSMSEKDVTAYPLDLALGDIVQYFYDGTLTRAFERLASEAKKSEQEAEELVNEAMDR